MYDHYEGPGRTLEGLSDHKGHSEALLAALAALDPLGLTADPWLVSADRQRAGVCTGRVCAKTFCQFYSPDG